jgi:GNAT superfamily N-acetyltransferase
MLRTVYGCPATAPHPAHDWTAARFGRVSCDGLEPTPGTLAEDLRARFPGVRVTLETNGAGFVILSALIVPKGERNSGTGSAVLAALAAYADAHGLALATTPSADFGGSVARLRRFYARFGFAPNKGRSRDYGTQETMIRRPQH